MPRPPKLCECGKQICRQATRCGSCAGRNRNTSKEPREYLCACGKTIAPGSERCRPCSDAARRGVSLGLRLDRSRSGNYKTKTRDLKPEQTAALSGFAAKGHKHEGLLGKMKDNGIPACSFCGSIRGAGRELCPACGHRGLAVAA